MVVREFHMRQRRQTGEGIDIAQHVVAHIEDLQLGETG